MKQFIIFGGVDQGMNFILTITANYMKIIIPVFLPIILGLLLSACNASNEKKLPEDPGVGFDEQMETDAIMKVIEGETDCFFHGDYECWKKYWSHESYVLQAWNNSDGTADASLGWDNIDKQGKDWIEKYYQNGKVVIHPVVKREKPLVKFFNDKTAFLVWRQYNADMEKTSFRTSHETRIMEKNEDGWKIVNVSAFWDTEPKIPYDSLQIN